MLGAVEAEALALSDGARPSVGACLQHLRQLSSSNLYISTPHNSRKVAVSTFVDSSTGTPFMFSFREVKNLYSPKFPSLGLLVEFFFSHVSPSPSRVPFQFLSPCLRRPENLTLSVCVLALFIPPKRIPRSQAVVSNFP